MLPPQTGVRPAARTFYPTFLGVAFSVQRRSPYHTPHGQCSAVGRMPQMTSLRGPYASKADLSLLAVRHGWLRALATTHNALRRRVREVQSRGKGGGGQSSGGARQSEGGGGRATRWQMEEAGEQTG